MFRSARQGWFDDKVEARNAVVRVAQIFDARAIDRRELPWVMAGTRSMSRRRKNKVDRIGPKPFDYLRERYSASDLFGSIARIARGGAPLAERNETLWGFLERGDTEGAVRLLEQDGEVTEEELAEVHAAAERLASEKRAAEKRAAVGRDLQAMQRERGRGKQPAATRR